MTICIVVLMVIAIFFVQIMGNDEWKENFESKWKDLMK